jgi:hypothetical protein
MLQSMITRAILLLCLIPIEACSQASHSSIMGASATACESYLRLHVSEREPLAAWVSGRIVAIVPAPAQPFLRSQPWERLLDDLSQSCAANPSEDLFTISALLAHDYHLEAEAQSHGASDP